MKIQSVVVLFFMFLCGAASAQNYSGDARKIAMGGIGHSENIASGLIEEEKQYRSIVIPLGLFQLLGDLDKFDPDDKDIFDPILAMEYAANPIHYGFDRVTSGTRGRFVTDIINADLGNLNTYRGFKLTNQLSAEGLLSPTWGKTFKVKKNDDGSFHGFYVGAGPYISAKTDLDIDEELTEKLGNTDEPFGAGDFDIANRSIGQLALSITGGYRGRINIPGHENPDASDRDGIYLAVNYHYLHGFRYEDMDLDLQFSTDSGGDLTIGMATDPLSIDYLNSRSGKGFALDFGVGVVMNGWEFGFGANGVANRINWDEMTLKNFRLVNLEDGGEFVEERIPLETTDLTMKLPVQYSGNVGYTHKAYSARVEISHGFQDTAFHGGVEYRLVMLEFRGGMRYGLERWHPTMGIGLNLGKRFSIDMAALWSTTNIERKLRPGLAISLRLNRVETTDN